MLDEDAVEHSSSTWTERLHVFYESVRLTVRRMVYECLRRSKKNWTNRNRESRACALGFRVRVKRASPSRTLPNLESIDPNGSPREVVSECPRVKIISNACLLKTPYTFVDYSRNE